MLFSNESVATAIVKDFEPVWVSLRPVPLITLDFGNGTVIRRTLHGNVATYACTGNGEVLDVLPGVYQPLPYIEQLQELVRLNRTIADETNVNKKAKALQKYHRAKQGVLEKRISGQAGKANSESRATAKKPGDFSPADLAAWNALAEDTRQNETTRRLAIHNYLAMRVLVRPDDIAKWIYREVLHSDLDDPYMGLRDLLFDNYPFIAEDQLKLDDAK